MNLTTKITNKNMISKVCEHEGPQRSVSCRQEVQVSRFSYLQIKVVYFNNDNVDGFRYDGDGIRGAQRVVEDFTEMVAEARRQIIIIIIIFTTTRPDQI